ncbi:MAG TPA: HD-GYP domain-containing protein [Tepidisphaeraceae bacterium]|nr:HD-GYP domain-containing protein [Tepidisphaeraceae bacterium]
MSSDNAPSERQTSGRILWVGPDELLANLASVMASNAWESAKTDSPVGAIKYLRTEGQVDVIAMVPGDDITPYLETCRTIKFDSRSNQVVVAFLLTANHSLRSCDPLESGADACFSASASHREIQIRLQNAIRVKQAMDSMEHAGVMILSLARTIEGKDSYTCGHVERVGAYSVEIGRKIGLPESDLQTLRTGGIVHDIGKVGIPEHVLNKPGKLTDEEFAIIKRHPVIGYDILKPMRTFTDVLPIVRWHHEKPNGRGYPDGLKGDEIPVIARIAAVADWFDALITDRPYRKAFAPDECLRIMREGTERGDLDPALVEALADLMSGEMGPALAAMAQTTAQAA